MTPRKPKEDPDYHLLRPRRCAWCAAWFRPLKRTIPVHADAKGMPCLGSEKDERPPLRVTPKRYWRDDAACRGTDLEIFWTTKDGADMFKALGYCRTCPVLEQCYQNADNDPHFTGVAGGTVWTPRERRLRREAGRAMAPQDSDATDPDEAQAPEHRPSATVEE